jgi:hypothetical protein
MTGRNQGISSKNLTRPGYKAGTPARAARPAGAAAIGGAWGTHITEKREEAPYRGQRVFDGGAISLKLGNELTTNVGQGGPGKGRTLFGQSGSQGRHGAVNLGNPRPNAQRHPLNNK